MYLGQNTNFPTRLRLMYFDNPVNNWNISIINIEYHNLPHPNWLLSHIQKEYIASVKSRLHASTQNDNNLQQPICSKS